MKTPNVIGSLRWRTLDGVRLCEVALVANYGGPNCFRTLTHATSRADAFRTLRQLTERALEVLEAEAVADPLARLEDWRYHDAGRCLSGVVYGHPRQADGAHITTSTLR